MSMNAVNKMKNCLNTPEHREFPLVSIITVVYNGEEFLEDTILNVVNQNYKNIEYIIIDGGSTDGSLDIIKKYEDKINYWVSEPDKGIYDAMNKGILRATGYLVGMINADDYYLPGAIESVVNHAKASTADIFYGSTNIVMRDCSKTLVRKSTTQDWKLYAKMSIPHPSTFVKRTVYMESLYPTNFRIAGDYYFFLKLKLDKKRFEHINSLLVHMRDGGVSAADTRLTKRETMIVKKELLGALGYYLSEFPLLINSMFKKFC